MGGTIGRGYGVKIRGKVYVPNDRVQSFGLVEACTAIDGSTCADRAWAADELDAVSNAVRLAGRMSGFELRSDATNPEVRVHAALDAAPTQGCLDGLSTCWFASTLCVESAQVLLDASGAPLLDTAAGASSALNTCSRWTIEVSVVNAYAWADFLELDRRHVLESVILHEMGHTLGLRHTSAGLMRARLPVCYFIEPGDPRDTFDSAAKSDAFQRFQCLEGVKEPELAPHQRAKLDAYQAHGLGWSIATLP